MAASLSVGFFQQRKRGIILPSFRNLLRITRKPLLGGQHQIQQSSISTLLPPNSNCAPIRDTSNCKKPSTPCSTTRTQKSSQAHRIQLFMQTLCVSAHPDKNSLVSVLTSTQ